VQYSFPYKVFSEGAAIQLALFAYLMRFVSPHMSLESGEFYWLCLRRYEFNLLSIKDFYYLVNFFFICCNNPQWARVSSFTRLIDHKQRRTTVSTTPLDE
jgi:hypothetical protein